MEKYLKKVSKETNIYLHFISLIKLISRNVNLHKHLRPNYEFLTKHLRVYDLCNIL